MLRYGIKVQPGAGENHVTVWLIDWHHPQVNDFGVAEEVTVKGSDLLNWVFRSNVTGHSGLS
jgi:type I restriction enzyme, R subunit